MLFSGTSIVSAADGAGGAKLKPGPAPNTGALCYVLRTGFGSTQGSLMQVVEFSTESVSPVWQSTVALRSNLNTGYNFSPVKIMRKGSSKLFLTKSGVSRPRR